MINESNVTIMVQDMDKAVDFYKNIGLELKKRWENHYAMLTTSGMTIGLHPAHEEAPASGHISLGFMVDDAQQAKSLLDKNNISYQLEDGKSGIYLHFQDPDGTALYFTQPRWSYSD